MRQRICMPGNRFGLPTVIMDFAPNCCRDFDGLQNLSGRQPRLRSLCHQHPSQWRTCLLLRGRPWAAW